ncbi:MAG TPA: transketolase [Gemmataceae bacterium]|jgi:transketolase|nr:transketolase [Gemmataceae bacterium]
MNTYKKSDLVGKTSRAFDSRVLRRTILNLAYHGQTAHIGCALSLVEILAVLYREHLRQGNGEPNDPERDYLVLSKGHGVMAQYACLHELGWIRDEDVACYFADGSKLHGLAHAHVPGVEATTGSLGHGMSIAVGIALGCKRQRSPQRVFAIVGDGELNSGPIWEAALFAAHHHLNNLIVIVDANGHQALGRTAEVMQLGSIAGKFAAFDWNSAEVDGHDEAALSAQLHEIIRSESTAPSALVARTVKGKGVSFMEDDNRWHYGRLNELAYEAAVAELKL